MESNSRKIFLILLKFIPFLTALLYFIGTCVRLFGGIWTIGSLYSLSLIPFVFILTASYLFKFCFYHRIFLYYSFGVDLLSSLRIWFNWIPKTNLLTVIVLLSFFIVCVIALINYLKHNEQVRIFKDCPTKHYQ